MIFPLEPRGIDSKDGQIFMNDLPWIVSVVLRRRVSLCAPCGTSSCTYVFSQLRLVLALKILLHKRRKNHAVSLAVLEAAPYTKGLRLISLIDHLGHCSEVLPGASHYMYRSRPWSCSVNNVGRFRQGITDGIPAPEKWVYSCHVRDYDPLLKDDPKTYRNCLTISAAYGLMSEPVQTSVQERHTGLLQENSHFSPSG